jgi:hypothetical protein
MIKVYIAAPYTLPIGEQFDNVVKTMEVYDILADHGFNPFNPLLSHFQQGFKPRHYDWWIKVDLEWLDYCDCLLRLPGESRGADKELNRMVMAGKPVFYNINDLVKYYGGVL